MKTKELVIDIKEHKQRERASMGKDKGAKGVVINKR